MEIIFTTTITALISSLVGAIVGSLVSVVKTKRRANDEARKEANDLKEMIRQNTIMTCRMSIYDEHFSTDEKLEAYKVYRGQGGNHQTKTYMDSLVGCDVDEYLEKHTI